MCRLFALQCTTLQCTAFYAACFGSCYSGRDIRELHATTVYFVQSMPPSVAATWLNVAAAGALKGDQKGNTQASHLSLAYMHMRGTFK